jgi:hypothetical protein
MPFSALKMVIYLGDIVSHWELCDIEILAHLPGFDFTFPYQFVEYFHVPRGDKTSKISNMLIDKPEPTSMKGHFRRRAGYTGIVP